MTAPFIDTNIFVYAATEEPRGEIARLILRDPFHISVQTLNEFALAARRKLKLDWLEINLALEEMKAFSDAIFPVTLADHERAMSITQSYGLRIFDANQVAVALGAGADLFLSENMHDGLVIEGRLTICNPFA